MVLINLSLTKPGYIMNKREENKLTMYKGTLQVLDSNSDLYAAIPMMIEAVTDLRNTIQSIDSMDVDFLKATKGSTAGKAAEEDKIILVTLKAANALYIYAVRNKNEELKTDSKTNQSELDRLRDTELANKSNQIITKAESMLTELAGYGITQEFIDNAKAVLSSYETSISKQQEKYAERSMNREAFTNLFVKVDSTLNDELDSFMEMFSDTQTNFYNQYKSARVIKDLGTRTTEEEPIGDN